MEFGRVWLELWSTIITALAVLIIQQSYLDTSLENFLLDQVQLPQENDFLVIEL